MNERRERSNEKSRGRVRENGTTRVVVSIVLLLLIALSLIGSLGGLGDLIKAFIVGVFGFGAYFLLAIALLFIVLKGFRLMKKRIAVRPAVLASILFLIFMVFLQVFTTHKLQDWHHAAYGNYLSACYHAGISTSGGLFFGLITYPLLAAMGKIAAIPLAVLFFVVLFIALYPLMRDSAGTAPTEERAKGKRSAPRASAVREKTSASKENPLRLFVDRVRPGQKDARKIKMRGFFSAKGEEPTFFDYRDTTPLNALEGMVPEERAERIDPYASSPADSRAEGGFFDGGNDSYLSSRNYFDQEGSSRDQESDDYDEELPDFVKKYAGERAEANRKLYGRDDLSSIIPDEPRFDLDEQPAEQKEIKSASPEIKKPTYRRPQARPGDIISDIHDLHRLNEKQASEKKSAFLGENAERPAPAAFTRKEEPSVASPIRPPLFERKPEPPVEEPKPFFREEEQTAADDTFDAVITPREASMLTPREIPQEPKASAPVPSAPVPPAPAPRSESKPFDDFEQIAEPLRTRKPRSDIGGTHRTSDASAPSVASYISPKQAKQINIDQVMEAEEEEPARPYTPPPVTLLEDIPPVRDEEGVEERAETLVQALSSFNIESRVIDHKTGPTFTQFAVTLPDNMSVNKLTPLEKDIKRKLMIEKNIRIISSVPGLDAVGIEVPNKHSSLVGLRSIISAPEFEKEGKLYFVIGVDVSGKAVYGDLLKMPHLLVAGSTGSGKSVCLNVMICSIMYHYPPEMVRFIMIDPKQVELSVYKNMPHMLMPSTVIEPDKAINALTWAVNEMERRYHVFMENDCRNIGEYNAIQQKRGGKKMYYIVLIVDEMADLMANAKRDVEDKVGRITSKARAAGIHLVVATQRPSVDVITGTIKNNIPTRIAFKVTSFTDSKTILDRGGAESLFGFGDMLYSPPEGGDPIRLQGPYITTPEISDIVRFVKEHNDTRFDSAAEKIIQAEKDPLPEPTGDSAEKEDGEDEYFTPALLYFIKEGQASISKLQIKYRIGYGRAARIVAEMADRGYLGPAEAGNKSRQVNMTLDEYYELYGEDGIDGDEAL